MARSRECAFEVDDLCGAQVHWGRAQRARDDASTGDALERHVMVLGHRLDDGASLDLRSGLWSHDAVKVLERGMCSGGMHARDVGGDGAGFGDAS